MQCSPYLSRPIRTLSQAKADVHAQRTGTNLVPFFTYRARLAKTYARQGKIRLWDER